MPSMIAPSSFSIRQQTALARDLLRIGQPTPPGANDLWVTSFGIGADGFGSKQIQGLPGSVNCGTNLLLSIFRTASHSFAPRTARLFVGSLCAFVQSIGTMRPPGDSAVCVFSASMTFCFVNSG